jgi:hypothetical protein
MLALVNYFHAIKSYLNQGKAIPFLILNGDILELATSTYPISSTYFRLFLTELAKRKLFDRYIYLPGNHDHGLWSLIRDTQFVESLSRQSGNPTHFQVEHTTSLSIARQSPLLTLLASNLPMQIESPLLFVANPVFRLQSWRGHDFLFHHGHLLEDIYKLLSLLRDRVMKDMTFDELKKKALREHLGELEGENWPWIDFVWSGFARAGRVGHTVEAIYELLSKPQGMKKMIERLGDVLRTEFEVPGVPEGLEDNLFRFILKKALQKGGVGSDERADPKKPPFSEELKNMTQRFLRHYMYRELADEGLHPATDRTCFVFGHTHKPFLDELQDDQAGFGTISAVNSGGWVIESDTYWPNHSPGIVIGSNAGDIALIKYTLDENPGSKIITQGNWDHSFDQLNEHQELANAVAKAVAVRRPYFKERVKKTKKILKNLSK